MAAAAIGGEFAINTTTALSQTTWSETPQAVAMDADGDFVVTWTSVYQVAGDFDAGIFAQRYNASGVRQGSEFRVNTTTADLQLYSSVAMDADGDFVVTWSSFEQDGSGYGIYAQRFNAAGVKQGSEFRVNTTTANDQRWSTVAMDADGDFTVTWSAYEQDGDKSGIYAQRYNASGVKQGSEFRVNETTAGTQYLSTVAMDDAGNFVVAWTSGNQATGELDVYARRFSSAGAVLGGEFRVNTHTAGAQYNPSIAMDADGDFVVSWTSAGQDGNGYGVYAQRFSAAGATRGAEFRVNTFTTSDQGFSTVAMNDSGDFVVTWSSFGQDGDDFGIFRQQYTAGGAADGIERRVNTTTAEEQAFSSVAMDATGNFVVVWTSLMQDGSLHGVFGQRFSVTAGEFTLDIDANGDADALSDGILSVRYLFGFRGDTLTSGALATDATRTAAAEIEAFLAQGVDSGLLDVDGNGRADALTDGILATRYLFGFRGDVLISGAVATDATRTSAAQIEAWLEALLPAGGTSTSSVTTTSVSSSGGSDENAESSGGETSVTTAAATGGEPAPRDEGVMLSTGGLSPAPAGSSTSTSDTTSGTSSQAESAVWDDDGWLAELSTVTSGDPALPVERQNAADGDDEETAEQMTVAAILGDWGMPLFGW